MLSLFLAFILTVMLVPSTALAALGDLLRNDPAYNQEILDALRQITGDEADAEAYYALLQRYNLLDEDGNAVENWSVTLDGEELTLDGLREVLAGDYDPDKLVWVDGTAVTLGNLDIILQIEDYIAYIRDTYFSGQTWTEEELAALESLREQVSSSGIEILAPEGAAAGFTSPTGTNHDARVSIRGGYAGVKYYDSTGGGNTSTNYYYFPIINLTGAEPGQKVTFMLNISSSLTNHRTVEVELTADETGEASINTEYDGQSYTTLYDAIYRGEDLFQVSGYFWTYSFTIATNAPVYFQGYDIEGALFSNGKDTMVVSTTGSQESVSAYTESAEVTGKLAATSEDADKNQNITTDTSIVLQLDGALKKNLGSGVYDSAVLEVTGLGDITVWADYDGEDGSGWEYAPVLTDRDASVGYYYPSGDGFLGHPWFLFGQFGKYFNLTGTYGSASIPGGPYGMPFHTEVLGPVIFNGHEVEGDENSVWAMVSTNESDDPNEDDVYQVFDWENKYAPLDNDQMSGSNGITVSLDPNSKIWSVARGDSSIYMKESGGNTYGYLLEEYNFTDVAFTLHLDNRFPPEVQSVTAPAGEYYPGMVVPIVVRYSEMVSPEGAYITVNGTDERVYAADEGGYSRCLTFPYEVKELDNASLRVTGFSVTDIAGDSASGSNMNEELTGVSLVTPVPAHAFGQLSAQVADALTAPRLVVSLPVKDDDKMTAWLASSLVPLEGGAGGEQFQTVTEAKDGMTPVCIITDADADGTPESYPLVADSQSVAGATLTASIDLPMNTDGADKTWSAELSVGGRVVLDNCAAAVQSAAAFITGDDLSAAVSVKQSDGTGDYKYENPENPVIYVQDNPKITASFALAEKDFSFGDTSRVTTYQLNENGSGYALDGSSEKILVDSSAHFVWWSSDPAVANIDAKGAVTPTGSKAGSVKFYITALNGGVAGKAVTAETEELTFGVGLTPFLTIPTQQYTALAGQNVSIYWSSNLCDKNGETPTAFAVKVTRGAETVYETTVTGNAAAPAASVTIPASVLEYHYTAGGSNIFTVTVSSAFEGVTYTAATVIDLSSPPATVSLDSLGSYYLSDTAASVPITWRIDNFDQSKAGAEYKFEVLRGDTVVDTVTSVNTGESGVVTGSCSLPITDVQAGGSPTSYREIYTVTLEAKNAADSTWSRDSFLLYVYDNDALKIWVNGKEAGDKLVMSNVDAIRDMDQADILALKRDIYLKDMISVNYGEYAWAEVADQIQWASDNNSAVTVNYQQGTLYEDIRNFSYVSYRPTTELGLSGVGEGTATVTAAHKLTGIDDKLDVTVETLENHLYLFQCYPQAETTLTFREYADEARTRLMPSDTVVTSDSTGAAAYFSEYGIASDVYCTAEVTEGKDTYTYLGTFYQSLLETGEGDWTKLERYPCNTLQLRRAAYAYVYLKNEDGTPYTGEITFYGGVYVNNEYRKNARFALNSSGEVSLSGSDPQQVKLGSDGKLEVTMDQTQWDLPDNGVTSSDAVTYAFLIERSGSDYYPLLIEINASANQDAYVSSGEAVVNFQANSAGGKRPYVAAQTTWQPGYTGERSILGSTWSVGPSDSCPEAVVRTTVLWWNGETSETPPQSLQFYTDSRVAIADGAGESSIDNLYYPFSPYPITRYTVTLNRASMEGMLGSGESTGVSLEYYADGKTLSRKETMSFQLCNMLDVGRPEEDPLDGASSIKEQLADMGGAIGVKPGQLHNGDQYVQAVLNLVSDEDYITGGSKFFQIQLAPTTDPTKFLGFIQVNVSNMDENVAGVQADPEANSQKLSVGPGKDELMFLTARKTLNEYKDGIRSEYNSAKNGEDLRSLSARLSGYAESLIYYNFQAKKWEIQILDGGFGVGGGVNWSWYWNIMCGPVPLTYSLSAGASVSISMDALAVSYYDTATQESGIGTDFLTELRAYLYVRFFAGVGIDYSVVAFKLGVFGQLSMDVQFRWLNRPYIDGFDSTIHNVADGKNDEVLNANRLKIDGQIGMEIFIKLLFISYEKILFSTDFTLADMYNPETWNGIEDSWAKNQAALRDTISDLVSAGAMSVNSLPTGGQALTLNLAPTLESRDYLDGEERVWMYGIAATNALDSVSGLAGLESNTYPYANPIVSDDGSIVVYLSDMGSDSVEDTRAVFATRDAGGAYVPGNGGTSGPVAISEGGYGDSQLSLSGGGDFAVSAWVRETVSLSKDAGAVLTDQDQMMQLNGTDVYAAVYTDGSWTATPLSSNGEPDLAPVAAAANGKAIVAWRSVATTGKQVSGEDGASYANLVDFDQKDTIVYKIYLGDGKWSDMFTLYNGTSGNVKGIVADMLSDGTAAVAYTLDTDGDDSTTADREIVYAVIDTQGNVVRSVQVTRDAYLDENPQLTSVTFPGSDEARFVLGWYTEQSVSADSASALDGGTGSADEQLSTSDIRLIDFDGSGVAGQLLPDSISRVASDADVSITSNFRFTKNADKITDLSILWVERYEGEPEALEGQSTTGGGEENPDLSTLAAERDVLKGVKFYTYGEKNELIRFTSAIDVAEMDSGTLIDHFDAYVSDRAANEIKAVILGTTYGAGKGTENRIVTLADGETEVKVTVPTQTTQMYTATETYQDKIAVSNLLADYETVRLGAATQIRFTVENQGIHAISSLDIQVGDVITPYTGLNLLPGDSVQLYADYTVPKSGVEDPAYTVTAHFDERTGAAGSAKTEEVLYQGLLRNTTPLNQVSGTVYLDLPDVEITDASIVREENGQRTIQIKLNNHSDAVVDQSGRSVRLSFYTDATCENPIPARYFAGGSGDEGYTVTISDAAGLSMVDEGGYSLQVTFNIGEYVKGDSGEVREIPENGVTIYLKAEVLEDSESDGSLLSWLLTLGEPAGEPIVLGEPTSSDNYAAVTCDNLSVRTGKDVSIDSDFSMEGGTTTVHVTLQNTRLNGTTTGNVIVTLLDESGNVLEQKQSYGTGSGLITLGAEERKTLTFTFEQAGASAVVTYSDLILEDEGADNAELDSLTFTNIPGITLDSFVEDPDQPGTYRASASTFNLTFTGVVASSASGRAQISLNGSAGGGNVLGETVPLTPGEVSTITITVTSGSEAAKTYILTVNNGAPSAGGSTYWSVTVQDTEQGSVTVNPTRASQGTAVTITTAPDDGCQVERVTVTTGSGREIPVTRTQANTYTFVMPAGSVYVNVQFTEAGALWNNPFTDVSADAWYYDAVHYVWENGLMNGTSAATFEPTALTSRAMSATVLWRLEGSPVVNALIPFDDVPEGRWYSEAIRWAASQGIVDGCGNGLFLPDDSITREQMAAILFRYAQYKGMDTAASSECLSAFPDGSQVSGWARSAMSWAVEQGLIQGTGSVLNPQGGASRVETAAILMRFIALASESSTAAG